MTTDSRTTDVRESGMAQPVGHVEAAAPVADPATTSASGPVSDKLPRAQRNVIALMLVAAFVVILNETVMSVALPVLQKDLGIGPSVGQWLTTAFMLTMAVVIPITGYLIQRIQTKPLFLISMSLFSAGTLLAMLSPGFGVLLLARVIQASGTAIMMPLLMTTVLTLVPARRRGQMMGNISIVISVAPALGPTLSGFVLDHFGWRAIFGIVLPVALLALVLGAFWVVSVSKTNSAKIDLISIPFAALGFGGLVYGLASIGQSAEDGGPILPIWALFTIGGAALLVFLGRQLFLQRRDRALLDLRVFRSPVFSVAMGAMLLATLVMFGSFILIPYFAQSVLGLEPLVTGLITLPGGLLMGFASPIIGRLYDRYRPQVLLIPGTLLISAGMWMLSAVSQNTEVWYLVVANILMSVGLASTFTPIMTAGLGAVPRNLYSHGSAVLNTFQQVSAAAGTALFVTVMSVGAATAAAGGAAAPAAVAFGVHSAFLVGAILSVVLIVAILFVRKPADAPEGAFVGH